MSIDFISKEVLKIKKRYDETDPIQLCNAMKISLIYHPMGLFTTACKGFYMQQSRKQAIVINNQLPKDLQRIVLFHEIGHAVLHKNLQGVKNFHDFTLFDETSIYEYQANIFAADYLMSDEDVLNVLNDNMSFFTAASTLCVPAELLDFKFRVLKRKGYKIVESPLNASSTFLKNY